MRMSEFSKLTGIKRTALQLYDKKGLLQPIPSSRNGYWEYDEDKIGDALLLIVLQEAGYKLSEIKEYLDDRSDLNKVLDSAETKIKDRIERLEGCIRYIDLLRTSSENQYLLQPILSKISIDEVLKKSGGYRNEIDSFIETTKPLSDIEALDKENKTDNENDEEDPEFNREMTRLFQAIFLIPLLMDKEPPEGPSAQETLNRILTFINSHAEENEEPVTQHELAEMIMDILNDIPGGQIKVIEEKLGKGCVDYLIRAIKYFETERDS